MCVQSERLACQSNRSAIVAQTAEKVHAGYDRKVSTHNASQHAEFVSSHSAHADPCSPLKATTMKERIKTASELEYGATVGLLLL